MGFTGLLVYVFDELFGADEDLRRQARMVAEAADDLNITVGGLPPEATAVLAHLRGLRGELADAARMLRSAGAALGQTAAAVKQADQPGVLDYTKALLAIGSGEASMLLLRRQRKRVKANAAAEVRRREKLLAEAERSGGKNVVRRRKRELRDARDAYNKVKRAERRLDEAGALGGMSARTRRAIKALAPLFGLRAATELLNAAEFGNEVRKARNLRKGALEHLANRRETGRVLSGRADDLRGTDLEARTRRNIDAANEILNSPGSRAARRLIPVVNIGADGADFVNRAKKAWQRPNVGNIAATVAGGCYLGSNVPAVGLLADGCGTGIDGVKSVTDKVDEPEDVGDFIMGAPKELGKGVDTVKRWLGK